MSTVDLRTRYEGDETDLDPASFLDETVGAVEANGPAALRGADWLGLPSLTLDVEGDAVTFRRLDGRLTVTAGADSDLLVSLDRAAFSDLVQGGASTFGVQMTGRATIDSGKVDDFIAWEPVLRSLLDGRPVYEPGSIEFLTSEGAPLALDQSFTLDDDHDQIGHFLAEAGFLHLTGVFTEEEMSAVSADLDAAMADAERDDGASWWARTEAGEWYPARILGFNRRSPALRELLRSERFRSIGTFTDDAFDQRDPDEGDSAEGLHKRVGVVEGISDVSWHKDCSMGGHSRRCCGLTVGISITGAGPTNGELGVVPGSHRANIPALGIDQVDLPRLPLATETGDVTVHCSCTLHMSRPPVSAERRVVYTGFGLAARPEDRRSRPDPEAMARDRASLNDHVRRGQQENTRFGARNASFDL